VGKAAEHVEDYTVLLSLHHVSPLFEDDVVQTYDLLSDMGITDYTLLVTPMYMMKRTNTFTKDSMFTQFLQSLGLEIAQHGYSHVTKSGSSSEFAKLDREQMSKRMKSGRALLQRGFGITPKGFVPPSWIAPPLVSKIAKKLDFTYCVRENVLDCIAENRSLSAAARVIGEGTRSLSLVDAMVEIQLGGSLQVGVHPLDHRSNEMFDFLTDLRDNLGYRFVGYSSYLFR
jgi:predicted deacetylase